MKKEDSKIIFDPNNNNEINIYAGLSPAQIKVKEKKKLIASIACYIFFQLGILYQFYIGEAFVKNGPNIFLEQNPEGFYWQLALFELISLCFLGAGLFNYLIDKSIHFRNE